MKSKNLFLLLILLIIVACSDDDVYRSKPSIKVWDTSNVTLHRDEAFEYLNTIRENPVAFSSVIGDDLSYVEKRQHLVWNDTLALVARWKAADMAQRNYMGHQDPEGYGTNMLIVEAGYVLDEFQAGDPSNSTYESLSAGYSSEYQYGAKDHINGLIEDGSLPRDSKGHRKHLLGIGNFNKHLVDCGIGIAKNPNSKYTNYCVVVIANHTAVY